MKLEIDKMSKEQSFDCLFGVILLSVIFFVVWLASKTPARGVSVLVALIFVVPGNILYKKLRRQKSPNETIFTEESREEWLKKCRPGFIKYAFWSSVRFGFAVTIVPLFGMFNSYRFSSFLHFLFTFSFGALLGFTFSALEWWDNLDNEKEWKRKHAQFPPQ